MQKIKSSVLQNLIDKRVTGKELDLILYMSRYQDEYGRCQGIYYREACDTLGMSFQSFYNVLLSLQDKGIIIVKRESRIDYDVIICGNNFADKDFSSGYINTNQKIFYSSEFYGLKANEKLLIMELMRITYANRGFYQKSKVEFYDMCQALFCVTRRVMQRYIANIRRFFHVVLRKGRYIITPKKHILEKAGSESKRYNKHIVEVICRRKGIKDAGRKAVEDTAGLVAQYGQLIHERHISAFQAIEACISESLEFINRYLPPGMRTVKELRPSLVHKILKEEL